ncbi:MAG: glycosyltransferase, partial [bacterium]
QFPEVSLNGWDIYCSSSVYGEGFSNSIIEAMAAELPVVATEVGDARVQIDGTGSLVPPGDIDALYSALRMMILAGNRTELGAMARRRVLDQFTSATMVANTERALIEVSGRFTPDSNDRSRSLSLTTPGDSLK